MLIRPEILDSAVLISAMIPFRDLTYDPNLTGKWVIIANGRNDPTISTAHTGRLAQRLRDLGSQVQLLEHDAGHTIDPAQIPEIAAAMVRFRDEHHRP